MKYRIYQTYRYGVKNNFALLKGNGKVTIKNNNNNNFSFEFNKKNKEDVKNLLFFAKNYGVQFKNKKGYWNYNFQKNIIVTPQGIKFYLNHFDPLIFSETFLSDIHFCDFNLKNKI
jgi:protein associated with RNAse G/E